MPDVLLKDASPELAAEIESLLRKDGLTDLAEQVTALRIVEFCDCGELNCATFYTAPKPKRGYGPSHENEVLDSEVGLLVLDVVEQQIVCVEILDRPEIRAQLKILRN